jgi:hypothetical protein
VSETIRRVGLAPNTLEINQVRANLYAPIDASEHVALYLIALDRMVKAGVPITVITVDSCIAGEMVRITYPETGEQLARCAHDRLIERGVPKSALRVRDESPPVVRQPLGHHQLTLEDITS